MVVNIKFGLNPIYTFKKINEHEFIKITTDYKRENKSQSGVKTYIQK